MKRAWMVAGLLLPAGLIGCQNKLHDENVALFKENKELRARYEASQADAANRPDNSGQLASLSSQVAERDARIAELEQQLKQPTPGAGAQPGIEGIETTYDAAAGTLTVVMPGDVLFSSGTAELKAGSKATLDKVAAAIKSDYSGKAVRVEGHTDSDKITRTKAMWTDNLDLSLNRAAAVTRYLESKGVPSKQVTTSGYGDTKPRGGDKAKNRRVEIVVVTR